MISAYKAKRIKKAIDLFEWHVTYTDTDGLSLCTKCLRRSVKELNNLTGLRLSVAGIEAVAASYLQVTDNYSDATRFAVYWALGQYQAAL